MTEYKADSSFFDGARELGHSTFWAWILASKLDQAEENDTELQERIASADALLVALELPKDAQLSKLETEKWLDRKRGRADIYFEIDQGPWIIENKVKAPNDIDQLKRYGQTGTKVALLSTSFDYGWEKRLRKGCKTVFLLERIDEILASRDWMVGLIHEYRQWVAKELAIVRNQERQAQAFFEERGEANELTRQLFSEAIGQWLFMRGLFANDVLAEKPEMVSRGSSRGVPWTNATLLYPEELLRNGNPDKNYEGMADQLFWRVDCNRDGPYLALRQYNGWEGGAVPSQAWVEAKMHRLSAIRLEVKAILEQQASLQGAAGIDYPTPRRHKEWTVVSLRPADLRGTATRAMFTSVTRGLLTSAQGWWTAPQAHDRPHRIETGDLLSL